jgi:lipoic acid synthetase
MPVKRSHTRFPEWLKKQIPEKSTHFTQGILSECHVHTVCESARCPNRSECFSKHKATFMILGDICTRHCTFCSVPSGDPHALDKNEPARVRDAALLLNLTHVVITSVTRDDLPHGGAEHFVATVKALKEEERSLSVEVLIPDFKLDFVAIDMVAQSGIDILNHNIETVARLYDEIRPNASYERSLALLEYVRATYPRLITKSGLMVGLGETEDEVCSVLQDLQRVGISMVTIGQYLQPTRESVSVKEYVNPRVFDSYASFGRSIGIPCISAAPFVRSSYNADEALNTFVNRTNK